MKLVLLAEYKKIFGRGTYRAASVYEKKNFNISHGLNVQVMFLHVLPTRVKNELHYFHNEPLVVASGLVDRAISECLIRAFALPLESANLASHEVGCC